MVEEIEVQMVDNARLGIEWRDGHKAMMHTKWFKTILYCYININIFIHTVNGCVEMAKWISAFSFVL